VHACLGNSFRFQGRLHHGMHEAIVQRRIVVVFKQKRIYGYRPSHSAYSPSSSPCCSNDKIRAAGGAAHVPDHLLGLQVG